MARPKKAAPQWPVGGEPKAAPMPKQIDADPLTLAAALVDINNVLFADPKARSKDDGIEILSGGKRIDSDFPALYLTEGLAALAWWKAMIAAGDGRARDETFVWVEPPSLMHLQITIMDMRDRTHRVGNDRYVVRSKHAVVKAVKVEEAA